MLRNALRAAEHVLNVFQINPRRIGRAVHGVPQFLRDLYRYRAAANGDRQFPLRLGSIYPILNEFHEHAGTASGHYFHQVLWAARKIFAKRPHEHLDISSRIDGFVAHVMTFMPITVIDVRPLESKVEGLSFVRADATTLSAIPDNSVVSLSCLHALEHFGLDRYGDPIRPDAWQVGAQSLARVLAPHGSLYFSVPIGKQRLVFNGYRVFAPQTVLEAFSALQLDTFAAVNDGDWAFRQRSQPSRLLHREQCVRTLRVYQTVVTGSHSLTRAALSLGSKEPRLFYIYAERHTTRRERSHAKARGVCNVGGVECGL